MKTFPKGGIHPSDCKLSRGRAIEALPLPEVVTIPLAQHIGAPAKAKVAKGDKVLAGQLIAEAAGFMSADIHASVSGTVTAVDMAVNGQGLRQAAITIRREGDEWAAGIDLADTVVKECTLAPQRSSLRSRRRVSSAWGRHVPHACETRGASEPKGRAARRQRRRMRTLSHVGSPRDARTERGAARGRYDPDAGPRSAECFDRHRKQQTRRHRPSRAFGRGIRRGGGRAAEGEVPAGGEKQLIAALTGREVPPPPALPIDVGVVVCNASTAVAVYEAVQKNKPLVERVVTITGKGLKEPKNLLVRLGTPVSALIEAAGGLPDGDCKIVNGGPMMGRAMSNPEAPVTKGCSGITILGGADAERRTSSNCIKCARCVAACPMGLEPYLLSKMAQKRGGRRSKRATSPRASSAAAARRRVRPICRCSTGSVWASRP